MKTRFLERDSAAMPDDWKARLAELRRQQLEAVLHAVEIELSAEIESLPPAAPMAGAHLMETATRRECLNRGRWHIRWFENLTAVDPDPATSWAQWQQPAITIQAQAQSSTAADDASQVLSGNRPLGLIRRALEAQIAERDRQIAERDRQIGDLTLKAEREREQQQREIKLLELMMNALREEVSYLREQNAHPPSPIPPALLKRLKSLCHPDRWLGEPQEQTAIEVMQWLNSLSSRL